MLWKLTSNFNLTLFSFPSYSTSDYIFHYTDALSYLMKHRHHMQYVLLRNLELLALIICLFCYVGALTQVLALVLLKNYLLLYIHEQNHTRICFGKWTNTENCQNPFGLLLCMFNPSRICISIMTAWTTGMSLIVLHSLYGKISVPSLEINAMQHFIVDVFFHYFYGLMVDSVTVCTVDEECTEHDTVPKYNMLYILHLILTVKGYFPLCG